MASAPSIAVPEEPLQGFRDRFAERGGAYLPIWSRFAAPLTAAPDKHAAICAAVRSGRECGNPLSAFLGGDESGPRWVLMSTCASCATVLDICSQDGSDLEDDVAPRLKADFVAAEGGGDSAPPSILLRGAAAFGEAEGRMRWGHTAPVLHRWTRRSTGGDVRRPRRGRWRQVGRPKVQGVALTVARGARAPRAAVGVCATTRGQCGGDYCAIHPLVAWSVRSVVQL